MGQKYELEGQALGFLVPGILSSFPVLVVFKDPGELFLMDSPVVWGYLC